MVGLAESTGASRRAPKAGKLEREDRLEIEGQAGDRRRRGSSRRRTRSGGATRSWAGTVFIASSGSTEQSPKEQNTHEGTRAFVGGNSLAGAADPGSEQRPEVDATTAGASGQPLAGRRRQRREGTGLDERYRLTRGRKPLKREPWTRQRDETSPQGARRRKPSRVCETPGTERRRAWDARRDVDSGC